MSSNIVGRVILLLFLGLWVALSRLCLPLYDVCIPPPIFRAGLYTPHKMSVSPRHFPKSTFGEGLSQRSETWNRPQMKAVFAVLIDKLVVRAAAWEKVRQFKMSSGTSRQILEK